MQHLEVTVAVRHVYVIRQLKVNVQVSDEYVTTGLIIVLYILILVFLFRNFDFISFALA